ncbi:L,D-transpeptidase family protein [Paenibacillus antri]|uniref:L,D-transpeptidase family protein n=1 Tax=Paenibacillus antri TaxID=2582848 RepID=UPI00130523ED|nr:L,D-transpeptidase family protein [Paenibacillus antri]
MQRRLAAALLTAVTLVLLGWTFPASAAAETEVDSLLIVNKSINELAYFKDGELVRIFPVATGKTEELTPEGTFPIVNKIKNRPYYKEKIPGGDPANPLGKRWLGLHVGNTVGTTYAIHGNNNEKSIGKYVSAGCIRMYNDDIEWLFEQLDVGTKVVVTSSEMTFEELAVKHHYEVLAPFDASLSVNGQQFPLQKPLFLYQGVTYIPLRQGFELLGGIVHWDAETGLVTSTVGDRVIVHRPGTPEATLDGEALSLGVASRNRDGTVMIPLRAMATLTGWTVHWDAAKRTIFMERLL